MILANSNGAFFNSKTMRVNCPVPSGVIKAVRLRPGEFFFLHFLIDYWGWDRRKSLPWESLDTHVLSLGRCTWRYQPFAPVSHQYWVRDILVYRLVIRRLQSITNLDYPVFLHTSSTVAAYGEDDTMFLPYLDVMLYFISLLSRYPVGFGCMWLSPSFKLDIHLP